MSVSAGYLEFVVDQLRRVGPVTTRRMFGAVGIYSAERFFALVDDDRLYFKVDDVTRPDFEAAGMSPFRPYGDERTMAYYEVPAGVLEDVDRLGEWMGRALDVAMRARRPRRRR